jgi:hypothetical protein
MPKLYMFYLGGNAGRSNIEVHDIQFAVCDDYRESIPTLKAAWFGDADKIHIDGWQIVEWVDGYDVDVSDHAEPQGSSENAHTCISSMSAVIARDSLPRRTLSDCSLPPRPPKPNKKPCKPC